MHRRSRCTVHDVVRSEFDFDKLHTVDNDAVAVHHLSSTEHIAEHKPFDKHHNRSADTKPVHVDNRSAEPDLSVEHHLWHIFYDRDLVNGHNRQLYEHDRRSEWDKLFAFEHYVAFEHHVAIQHNRHHRSEQHDFAFQHHAAC
jgi:hypothetical protein